MSSTQAFYSRIRGENGSAELASTNDPRLDLFFKLVRNIPDDRLSELVENCFTSELVSSQQMVVDMFLLTFQTRDCRGGKGERDLFVLLFIELASRYPQTAIEILPLIPKYGCYRDLFSIAGRLISDKKGNKLTPLSDAILNLTVRQLEKDAASAMTDVPKDISLLAKWAPREKSAQSSLAKLIAERMFPGNKSARAQYRKVLSQLNRSLGTVEVQMCTNDWDSIEPTKIPSLCLMKNRKAFLNEDLKANPSGSEQMTGNRHPDDESRVGCRKRMREALVSTGTKKLKGKQLFPHEITSLLMDGHRCQRQSTMELDIFDAQWKAIRTATQDTLAAKRAESKDDQKGEGIDLGKLVALVDVSGSMSGIPMEVAVALGIMVSELADPAFANRVITFHEDPTWCTFEPNASIAEKVQTAINAPWGGSTDFEKAMELILDVAVKAKLTPEEIPNLIVFSDMQFNQAIEPYSYSYERGYGHQPPTWETHHERIKRRFAEVGEDICGQPYPVPEITYWNLRGDTYGFPVEAETPNVRMLSGFSPSLLKLVMSGEPIDEIEEEGVDAVGRPTVNPLATLRKALDDPTYDPVRVVLSNSSERDLSSYRFTESEEGPNSGVDSHSTP